MKNKIIDFVVILVCVIVLIQLLFNKILVFDTISYSLDIWISSIIPSLFPFFVISDILINYDVTKYIPKKIRALFANLFKVSDNVITIFFLSMISGFPSNARNTRTMYDMGLIDKDEASHCLMFTHFSNPLFILGTVSTFFFKNELFGIIILIAHYLSNIILGIMLKNYNSISNINYTAPKVKCQNFSAIFIKAIRNAIDNLLSILGTLTCFLVLASLIINMLNVSAYDSAILKGILEVTMGLKDLSLLNISDVYKVVIATMFISFGGLSVHMQVLSFLIDTEISYKYFFVARICQAVISGGVAFLLYVIVF